MKRNSWASVLLLLFAFTYGPAQKGERDPAAEQALGCASNKDVPDAGPEEHRDLEGQPVPAPLPTSPIQHIVVIVQENHSFDADFGALNQAIYTGPPGSPTGVDGISAGNTNPSHCGRPVPPFRFPSLVPTPYAHGKEAHDIAHSWDGLHYAWNGGKNDRFVRENARAYGDSGEYVMGYYSQEDLPYYYWLADHFAIADRYFCSVMGPTWVNRAYLYAGTSSGIIINPAWGSYNPRYDTHHLIADTHPSHAGGDSSTIPRRPVTIFEVMDHNPEVTWKYYSGDYDAGFYGSYVGSLYPNLYNRDHDHFTNVTRFDRDVESNQLPLISFLDASLSGDEDPENGQSEHPSQNVHYGQRWVADRVAKLMENQALWSSTVVLLTYDENGGFYDHVAPPRAPEPDALLPRIGSSNPGGYRFDHYGFRVPLLAISPFAKPHHVSHAVYDHTSILRFIENRIGARPLGARDAAADPLTDLFDFSQAPNLPFPPPAPRILPASYANPDHSVCDP